MEGIRWFANPVPASHMLLLLDHRENHVAWSFRGDQHHLHILQVHPHEGFLRTSRWNTSVTLVFFSFGPWPYRDMISNQGVSCDKATEHTLDAHLTRSLDLMAEGHTTSSQISQNLPVGSGVKSYQFVTHPNIYQPCFLPSLGTCHWEWQVECFFGTENMFFRLDILLRCSVSLLFCVSLLVCFLCFSAFLLLGVSLSFCSSNPNKLWKQ